MNIRALLACVALPALVPLLVASDARSFLIKGTSVSVQEGQMVVVTGNVTVQGGDMRIAADEITFDQKRQELTFKGTVTISSAGKTFTAKALTLDVSGDRLFWLSNGKISVGPNGTEFIDSRSSPLEFSSQLPRTPTELRSDSAK